jgi:hypothetical protein
MVEPFPPRPSFEWGLASVLTAGVLALAAVLSYLLMYTLEVNSFRGFDRRLFVQLAYAGYVWVGSSFLLSLLSALVGLRGLVLAWTRRQPVALGLLGCLLSLMAAGLWFVAAVAWHEAVKGRL